MSELKARCRKCQAEILQRTADRTGGFCMPCRHPQTARPVPVVEPGRRLDWMVIDLAMESETEDYADYFFRCTVTDKDPRSGSRSMIVGHNVGLFRISKSTGETELLYPMADDARDMRYLRAAATIRKQWEGGSLPKITTFACG